MANHNRNRSNQSYNDQDWNSNPERRDYDNDYNQVGNQRNRSHESRGYGQHQDDYNRTNYIPDNDENRNYGRRDYENTQYGTSGTYGYRGNDYEQDDNRGGYSGYENRDNYSSNYGRQDWGRGNVNTGAYSNNYGRSYQNRENRTSGGYGNIDNNRDRNQSRYGGDTSNHGNMNQGGLDRDWWDRSRDEVASWFGDDDAERRRRMDRVNGPNRGKGPKGYHRSDERIQEDVCDRLCDNSMIDASDIEVKVNNAEVILTGTVESREDKRRAEDIAEDIAGVSNVQNQLRVGRSEGASTTITSSTSTGTERRKNRNE